MKYTNYCDAPGVEIVLLQLQPVDAEVAHVSGGVSVEREHDPFATKLGQLVLEPVHIAEHEAGRTVAYANTKLILCVLRLLLVLCHPDLTPTKMKGGRAAGEWLSGVLCMVSSCE